MVVPSDGTSRLASVIRNHVAQRQGRQRPQLAFGTMLGDTNTPELMPDKWTSEPFGWGEYAILEHLQLRTNDRVLVAWMGPMPVVLGRFEVPTMETSDPPWPWWAVESGEHDQLRKEFDQHVLDYDQLRADFDSHSTHP